MKFLKYIILLLFPVMLTAQVLPDSMVVYTEGDKEIFDDYVEKFLPLRDSSMNYLVMNTGFYFLGTPYVSYTLEVSDDEKLIVNLRQLDCTTFAETCLALSRTLKSCCVTFDTYLCELQKIRYRYGSMGDYTTRLHYFSDWIYDNSGDKKIVKDLTVDLGGIPYPLYVDAMTRLRHKYVHLKDNDEFCMVIDSLEKIISAREHFYIPKERVDSIDIHEGDIIAMTINGKGLDIMHMGIAVRKDERLYFMHASSTGKEVMISKDPCFDYLDDIRACKGIMVLRPIYEE